MPISQHLNGERFDLETTRVVGLAFEVARAALRAEERGDRTDGLIAKHIIALAEAGERNADRLCDYALAKLREADGSSSQLFQSSSDALAASSQVLGPSFFRNETHALKRGAAPQSGAKRTFDQAALI